MNTLSLIHNFLNEEEDLFKKNLSSIINEKIAQRSKNITFRVVGDVFEEEENLNNVKPNYDVIRVLKECANQNSNISVILQDGKDSILKPSESKKILSVFDNLNEKNQARLINRLVESSANFTNTIEFCINFKGRYTQ